MYVWYEILLTCYTNKFKIVSILIIAINNWFPCTCCHRAALSVTVCPESHANRPFSISILLLLHTSYCCVISGQTFSRMRWRCSSSSTMIQFMSSLRSWILWFDWQINRTLHKYWQNWKSKKSLIALLKKLVVIDQTCGPGSKPVTTTGFWFSVCYSGFHSRKKPGVLLLPLYGVCCRVILPPQHSGWLLLQIAEVLS